MHGFLAYWPAALGLMAAVGLAGLCILTFRRARKTDEHDPVLDWRSLAENIAEAVILLKADGTVLFVNRWSSDRDVMIGMPIEEFIHGDDRVRWKEYYFLRAGRASVCKTDVFKMTLPEATTAYWEVRISPLSNGPHGADIMLCARDVTDSRLKETTKDVLHKVTFASTHVESLESFVRYIELQLARLVDTSNFYLALYDNETDTYLKFLSRDRSEPLTAEIERVSLKGGLTDYVRKTGKPVLMNNHNRAELIANGSLRTIGESAACWLGVPLQTRDDVLGVLVVQSYNNLNCYTNSDVELLSIVAGSIGRAFERKSAQAELKQREEKLRLFTERTPALLWSQDETGRITYATGAALSAIGLGPDSLVGNTLCQTVQFKDEDFRQQFETLVPGAPQSFQFILRERTFEAWIERTNSADGKFAGMTGVALDVTEKDRAGTELRRFFELSGDLFAVIDLQGVLVRCNDAYLNATGYTREERIGQPSLTLVHPDDFALAEWAMKRLSAGEPVIGLEARIVCKDGGCKWISWSSVLDPHDNLIYTSGKDVTSRREIENALHEREEQLCLFVENSPAALAMFDRDMNYMIVSERWRTDYNLGSTDFVGRSHYEVFPEISDEWKVIHKRCLNGATEQCSRDPFLRNDGTTDWVRWEIRPWYRADGTIGGIMMFTEVITDEVNAELELSRSRNLARQIVESSLDSVIAIDGKGNVTEWNPQAVKDFGYTHDEAIGKPLHDLIVPKHLAEAHVRGLEKYARSGHALILNRILNLPAIRKGGEEFPVEISICPIQVGDETHFSAFIRDISERLEKEKELTESRARLKEAQRIAGLGFWEWFAEKDEMFVSEEKLTLYDRPDLKLPITFARFLEIVHPDDRQMFIDTNQALASGQNSCELQYRIVRPTGEIRYAYSQGETARDEHGNILKLFGTTLDVTDRVLNEQMLRDSEQRLAMALEGSTDGFWDWNIVSGDCFFSPRIVEWLGYDAGEFIHKMSFWQEIVHPDSLPVVNRAFAEHVASRTAHYEVEGRIRTKSGEWIWVLSRGKVVLWDEHGAPLRAAGTWTNITDRKVIEARALQLGRILDNSVNEVYIVDIDSLRILETNQRARINTGYSLEDYQTLTIPRLTANWRESELPRLLHPLLNYKMEVVRTKADHRRSDGTTYPFEATLQLMEWQDKTVLVFIGSDATEKAKAEQKLERLDARIRQNQRLETIGTLAGGIAHDFNNILTPILGYADIAASELDQESTTRKDLEHVIQAAYRAKELVQQILAFSTQGDQARHHLKIDLVVKETLKLLRVGIPTNIDLVQSIENVGYVTSDPSMINQILVNLCANAGQAIGETGGVIDVSLTKVELKEYDERERLKLPERAYAKLCVRDSGKGMDGYTMGRMFEPFFTTEDVGKGTGLGLSVVHGIVKSHGGAIDVESVPDQGTRICVYLPVEFDDDGANLPRTFEDPSGSEHILLCDDDDSILMLGKQMLENYGYSVTATQDPVAALALLAQADPPVAAIVVDDQMPILSGRDVALAAHDYNSRVPVILLSAGQSRTESAECFAAVLSKPVGAGDLAHSVRKCIDESKMETAT